MRPLLKGHPLSSSIFLLLPQNVCPSNSWTSFLRWGIKTIRKGGWRKPHTHIFVAAMKYSALDQCGINYSQVSSPECPALAGEGNICLPDNEHHFGSGATILSSLTFCCVSGGWQDAHGILLLWGREFAVYKRVSGGFQQSHIWCFLLHWVFCGRTKVKSSKHCLEWEFRLIWEMICFSWKEIFLPGPVAMHRRQRLKSISPNTTLKSINPFNSNKFLLSTSLFQQSLLSAQIPLCTNHGIYLRHFPKDKNPL